MKIIAPNPVAPATDHAAAETSRTTADTNAARSSGDAVARKPPQDALQRLRDRIVATSAHAVHPNAQGIAEGLKFEAGLVTVAGLACTVATAIPQGKTAWKQDGNKLGGHTGQVAAHIAVGLAGGKAVGVIGTGVGEIAGAFIGGAFGGIGAVPGAMIGGIAGNVVGSYVGGKMAVDDFDLIEGVVNKRHA